VEQHHYRQLPFSKIRGRLIDGDSKMIKIPKSKEVESWLAAKGLPNYDEKGNDAETEGEGS